MIFSICSYFVDKCHSGEAFFLLSQRNRTIKDSKGAFDNILFFIQPGEIMYGLIIKEKPLNQILNQTKTIEVRGKITYIRGLVALIESGSGLIKGITCLYDCHEVAPGFFNEFYIHHLVKKEPYKKNFLWKLMWSERLIEPIKYKHPQGAVIWVKDVL